MRLIKRGECNEGICAKIRPHFYVVRIPEILAIEIDLRPNKIGSRGATLESPLHADLWRGVAADQTNAGYPVYIGAARRDFGLLPFCGRPVRLRHTCHNPATLYPGRERLDVWTACVASDNDETLLRQWWPGGQFSLGDRLNSHTSFWVECAKSVLERKEIMRNQ